MNDIQGDTSPTTDVSEGLAAGGIVRCDACPALCRIRPGRDGACSRYADCRGRLIRADPATLARRVVDEGGPLVEFAHNGGDGTLMRGAPSFLAGTGEGDPYPDHKPAPFIVADTHAGCDTVTVVSEGLFSHCGAKVKIDTDRHLGAERSLVRADGAAVGHVTTAEHGAQMLSLGGVHHLTERGEREGAVTGTTLARLCNGEPVELMVDGGARIEVQAGAPTVRRWPRCSPTRGRRTSTRRSSSTMSSPAFSASITPAVVRRCARARRSTGSRSDMLGRGCAC